jgi:DNA ligase 1
MKPMLSGKVTNLKKIKYPVWVSPKLDGVRALVLPGVGLVSRTLKPIPNKHTRELFKHLVGCDGELIVGEATDPDVFNKTTSAVMTEEGTPDVKFIIFDYFVNPELPYYTVSKEYDSESRIDNLNTFLQSLPDSHRKNAFYLGQTLRYDMPCVLYDESTWLLQGFEGVMLRSPEGKYKFGRSTEKEQYLLKLKRFEDSEAVVLGTKEQLANNNLQTVDNLGHKVRSSHKENLVPAGMLGTLLVKDIKTDVEFEVGTGFTDEQRKLLWKERDTLPGKIVKYKYQKTGVKVKPRFPVFLGFRDVIDIGEV